MRDQDIKPSSEFMAALPFNVCLRHNKGAEIPFCGRMLRLFSLYLTPSDHPPHRISPYNPDSYFSHFFVSFQASCQSLAQAGGNVSVRGSSAALLAKSGTLIQTL